MLIFLGSESSETFENVRVRAYPTGKKMFDAERLQFASYPILAPLAIQDCQRVIRIMCIGNLLLALIFPFD